MQKLSQCNLEIIDPVRFCLHWRAPWGGNWRATCALAWHPAGSISAPISPKAYAFSGKQPHTKTTAKQHNGLLGTHRRATACAGETRGHCIMSYMRVPPWGDDVHCGGNPGKPAARKRNGGTSAQGRQSSRQCWWIGNTEAFQHFNAARYVSRGPCQQLDTRWIGEADRA
jgi:hypothetical protein